MAAHLRGLPRCVSCLAPATTQLYTTQNDPRGVYCSRHATAALNKLLAKEDRDDA